MSTERWQRLGQVFTDAAEQPVATRGDFLARACGPDAGLQDEVSTLLLALDASGEFLTSPAIETFARQVSREGWSVQAGDRIGVYTIVRRLGVGGMGEVWRARDERLARDVAIKLLLPHPAGARERVQALQQEARAAGTLNHTNVLTVYDVGDHGGAPYLVTECLEGESLRARLLAGPLSVESSTDIALQVAHGLGAAHRRGIVHRDLKPENVFLALDGRVKILDFGLATLHDPEQPATAASGATARALVAGTAGYMAPEQVRGEELDGRADLFALGAVLYEMLAGRQAFKAQGTLATLDAVLTRDAPDPAAANPAVPPALSRLVRRCLAKSRDERPATAADAVSALEAVVRARSRPPWRALLAFLRRPVGMLTLACVVLAGVAVGWHAHLAAGRARWARLVGAPEARRLLNHGDYGEAFLLAREAHELVPDDPQLRQLWIDVSVPVAVVSEPAGAEVALAPYGQPSRWLRLGRTPLDGARVPRSLFRLRLSKPGFAPLEGSAAPGALPRYRLDPLDAVPAGMVRVIGSRGPVRFGLDGALDDYWLERFEVTHRQYKQFVDAGGYERREFWREPFAEGARSLPWDEALARLRDSTGRPGPATWALGTYPDGQADFPVGGVSWYEAAAFAAFAGKSLPTIRHWYRGAGLGRFADSLTFSNLGGKGPAAVGTHAGLGPFGTYDMAGNVKEWCSTAMRARRFLLGGAWNEPRYMFADYDAREPFEREPGYGFRLAKYIEPLSLALRAPVEVEGLDPGARLPPPVGDAIFEVYRRQYAYDPTPLASAVEATEVTESGSRQTVAFDAAYGDERMRAHLFLPKSGSPPYQTILMFPGAGAFALHSSRDMSTAGSDFILRSGRAVLYPVYKGMYERSTPDDLGPAGKREVRTMWSRDLGRAIDYLETRQDIDLTRLAYYGVSVGGDAGVILTALEPRLKASVLQAAGLGEGVPPEIDPVHFAPRVRLPTLLLNGRYDFELPLETAQRPLFALLGTPAEHKRHVVLESGHAMPLDAVAREVLPWLDRYLGEVGAR